MEGSIFINDDYLFFNKSGNITRVLKTGGSLATLVNTGTANGYVADKTQVFFVDGTTIKAVPVAGGPCTILQTLSSVSISSMAVDDSYLYWTDTSAVQGFGKVFRVPKITQQTPVVSSTLSTLTVDKSSAPADGQGTITVTVRLVDGNGSPVAGKQIRIAAIEQLSSGEATTLSTVTQPVFATDGNGQATATMIAKVSCMVIISAEDVTDGVKLAKQPKVQFNTALVVPGQDLANAITLLATSSGDLLTNSIASIATHEGEYGDDFWSRVGEDKISAGLTVLNAVGSQMWESMGLGGGSEKETKLILEVTKQALIALKEDITADRVEDAIDIIAQSRSGLTAYGKAIANNNTAFEQMEASTAQQLLSGVGAVTTNYTESYIHDIDLRMQANSVISQIVSSQERLILGLRLASDYSRTSFLNWLFKGVDITTAAAGALIPWTKPLREGISIGQADIELASAARSLSIDQQGYNSTFVSEIGCSYLSCVIHANTESALNTIAIGDQPNPVTGKILGIDSKKLYVPASGFLGSIERFLGHVLANTTYVQPVGAYSAITIKNTSLQAAQFGVYAFFTNTVDVINDAGMFVKTAKVPIVVAQVTSISAGQAVHLTFDYFNNPSGGVPDGDNQITFSVLGYDGKGGLFAADQATSTMSWQQASGSGGASLRALDHPNAATPMESATVLLPIDTLIRSIVHQSSSNQTYQAQIWVVNPFAVPLLATITQPLPDGATVVNTDGLLGDGSIVWTNIIATNGLLGQSFAFTLSIPPGFETNLPPPSLVFSDETGTNSFTQTASPTSFTGLFPVGVRTVISNGTWGADTSARLIVTNFTAVKQAGSLAISLTNVKGNEVTNFSLMFLVDGLSCSNLSYTLPGTLVPGAYMVTEVLSINEGSGQVLSATYVLGSAPVRLGWEPTARASVDGFVLRVQGTAQFGYLIQSSTNLVDWQPTQYIVLTNSSGYFTDYYAPSYSQQFYRALTASHPQ